MEKKYITKQGLEKLKKELDYLKTVETRKIAGLIKDTASFGDLKENFAYHEAKEKQAFLQGKILEIEERIRNVEVIENRQNNKVNLGSKVLASLNGEKEEFEIVGPAEADSLKGKISYESPLGKAIINKSVNDEIEVEIGDNVLKCKIFKIE